VDVREVEVQGGAVGGAGEQAHGDAPDGGGDVVTQRVRGGGGADGAGEELRVLVQPRVSDDVARRADVGDGRGDVRLGDRVDGGDEEGGDEVRVVEVDGRGRFVGDDGGRGERELGRRREGGQLVGHDDRGGQVGAGGGGRGGRSAGAGAGTGEVVGGAAVVARVVGARGRATERRPFRLARSGGVGAEALEDVPALGVVGGVVLDVDEEGISGSGRVDGGAVGEVGGRGGQGGGGAEQGRGGWHGARGRRGPAGEEELDVGYQGVGAVGWVSENGVGEPLRAGGVQELVVEHGG